MRQSHSADILEPDFGSEDGRRPSSGRGLRRAAVIVVILLVAGFAAVHVMRSRRETQIAYETRTAAAAPPVVDTATVRPAPATLPLTLPGQSAAWLDSTIYARVDGYVGKWSADIGDHVHKGQVLATIETPDLDAQLAAARAKFNAAQAIVVARQADTDFAKTTNDRWANAPAGVVSQQEREAKRAGYDSAVAQLNEAKAQVGLDKADVDRYAALEQFKQVTAPYDGVIAERHIDVGNLVTAGSTASTTPLYRVVQSDPMRIFTDVPQSAAPHIVPGLPVRVTAGDLPGRVFAGKVTRIAGALDQQTRTLRAEIDIKNPDGVLVPGMYVNVAFDLPGQGLMQIPAAALLFRSGGPEVAVVGPDNRVAFRPVTIARDNGGTVEIGAGLKPGERIALNPGGQIIPGETVAVQGQQDADHAPAGK